MRSERRAGSQTPGSRRQRMQPLPLGRLAAVWRDGWENIRSAGDQLPHSLSDDHARRAGNVAGAFRPVARVWVRSPSSGGPLRVPARRGRVSICSTRSGLAPCSPKRSSSRDNPLGVAPQNPAEIIDPARDIRPAYERQSAFVAKVENRTTLKISQKLIFGLLCHCLAFQRHYGGP
jgi:hypothetical protein